MKQKRTPTRPPAATSAPTHRAACIRARAIAEALVAIDDICDLALQPSDFVDIARALNVPAPYLASVYVLGDAGVGYAFAALGKEA